MRLTISEYWNSGPSASGWRMTTPPTCIGIPASSAYRKEASVADSRSVIPPSWHSRSAPSQVSRGPWRGAAGHPGSGRRRSGIRPLEQLGQPGHTEARGTQRGPPVDHRDVDHLTGRRPHVRGQPGQEEQPRPELVHGDDPPTEVAWQQPKPPMTDLDDADVPGDQEQHAADHFRRPDQVIDLLGLEPGDEDVDQADRERQGAAEQHEGRHPAGPARLVSPPAPTVLAQGTVLVDAARRVDLLHQGGV